MPNLPIATLIDKRLTDLDLRPVDMYNRLGLKNIAKAQRRLAAIYAGDFEKTADLISKLHLALDLEEIEVAIEYSRRMIAESHRQAAARRDIAWRIAFRPHAVILTERTTPSSIS